LEEGGPGGRRGGGQPLIGQEFRRRIRTEPAEGRAEPGDFIRSDIKDERHLQGVVTVVHVILIRTIGGGRPARATIGDGKDPAAGGRGFG
jgi:hypothetical protein